MKLWIGGEIESDISDSFREIRNEIERSINQLLTEEDYGEGLKSWDIIFVVINGGGKPVFKFNKKTKETDIKLPLDYEAFRSAALNQKKLMILNGLIYSLEHITSINIKDFKVERLKDRILRLKNNYLEQNDFKTE